MSYLIAADFKKLIQADNLSQIINRDTTILESAMLDSQQVATEHLVQKYVLDQELADTEEYDNTVAYNPGQRIYLDAPAYDQNAGIYAVGDLALQDGNVYKCTTAISVAEPFNNTKWLLLELQYQIFYVPYPYPLFILNNFYRQGTQVFWNGKTYTCQIATSAIDHTTLLQYQQYQNVPLRNIFPDDPDNGVQYWGIGVSASLTPGILPIGWTLGDNRNRSLVRHCIAIALFIVHDRIAPRNIPELRSQRYKMAITWLEDASTGALTAGLPVIQPRSGGRIRWGGKIKNINDY